MKTIRTLFVLLALIAAGIFHSLAADVTGKWKAEFDSPIGHLKYLYDLKSGDGKITGKAVRDQDGEKSETEIKEGEIAGDDVNFVEVLKRDDQEIRIEYKGKLNGDEIKFTRQVGDFATMEVVAKREAGSAKSNEGTPAANKIKLKVVKVDSEESAGEDGHAANAVDGQAGTFWHTEWQDANPRPPHEIIIELIPPSRIKGFTYLPRQDESDHGNIRDYEIFLGDATDDFGAPIKKGSFIAGKEKQTVTFAAKTCRFIKLRALTEINDEAWTCVAEIGVIPEEK